MSFKQIHETQLAITAKLDNLQGLLNEFYTLVQRLVDENAATNSIHKDLMMIIRNTSEFMSQVPTLLNSLISMLTEERIAINDGWIAISAEIESIKKAVLDLAKQTQEENNNVSTTTTDRKEG